MIVIHVIVIHVIVIFVSRWFSEDCLLLIHILMLRCGNNCQMTIERNKAMLKLHIYFNDLLLTRLIRLFKLYLLCNCAHKFFIIFRVEFFHYSLLQPFACIITHNFVKFVPLTPQKRVDAFAFLVFFFRFI